MRKCYICKTSKNISEFYRDKYSKNGFAFRCKDCDKVIHREYYKKNKKVISERIQKWRLKNENEGNHHFWNRIAGRYGINGIDLQSQFLSQGSKCYYCNIKLKFKDVRVEHYYPKDKKRIVIACDDCNRLKWTRDGDEFKNFLKQYISRFTGVTHSKRNCS